MPTLDCAELSSGARQAHWAGQAVSFLRALGLSVVEVPGVSGFLPHVAVVNGALHVDVLNVLPGDLLHEAGHLALMPSRYRSKAHGQLGAAFKAMLSHLDEHPDGLSSYPECRCCRAVLQASDPEATAWQYAAACAIGLPDDLLFPANAFGGTAHEVLFALNQNTYLGIHGLRAAQWTAVSARTARGLPVFPELAFWLQPD